MLAMVSVRRLICLGLILVSSGYGLEVQAQEAKLDGLLRRSPSRANAVGYLNLPALDTLMKNAKMPSRLTGNIEDIWLIANMDPGSLRPKWEAGYATLGNPIEAKKLADSLGGYVDTVAGTEVVWSPRQMYLVPGKENRLGVLRPADRAMLSEWLEPGVAARRSEYLLEQSQQSEEFLSLMVALDIEDLMSPHPLAKKLEGFESLKKNKPESVASILASARGVSVIVGRRSLGECIFTVEFTKSPSSLLPIANGLLKEILDRNGTAAPEVLSWKVKADDNKLTFQGPLSESSLAGLLGVFSLRDQAESVAQLAKKEVDAANPSGGPNGYQSKAYFDDVNLQVEAVRRHKAQSMGARAKWNEQHARRIDEMGTLDVDPAMVDYGANVANMLRGNALTMQKAAIAGGAVKAQQGLSSGISYGGTASYGYGGYSYSGSGYYDPNTAGDYQAVTTAKARSVGYSDYQSMLKDLDAMTAQVRRDMTTKYNMQF